MTLWVRIVAAWAALSLIALPMNAFASDECDGMVVTSKKITWSGQELIAMPPAVAACLAKRVEQKIALDALTTSQAVHIANQDKLLVTANAALATAKELATSQEKRANELKSLSEKQADKIEELGAWYRSPLLWAGLGAGTLAVLFVIIGAHPSIAVTR